MITRKNHEVKPDLGLDTTETTSKPPTVADIIARKPLSPEFRPLAPLMAKLPPTLLVGLVVDANNRQLDGEQFTMLVTDAATLYSKPTAQCGACRRDVAQFHIMSIDNSMTALCDRCGERYGRGNVPAWMARNLAAVDGGAK